MDVFSQESLYHNVEEFTLYKTIKERFSYGFRLSQQIRQLRKKSGLTQAELGKEVGCSATSISLIESGKRYPSLNFLCSVLTKIGSNISGVLSSLQCGEDRMVIISTRDMNGGLIEVPVTKPKLYMSSQKLIGDTSFSLNNTGFQL